MAYRGLVHGITLIVVGMMFIACVMAQDPTDANDVTEPAIEQVTTDSANEQATTDPGNEQATTDSANENTTTEDLNINPGNGCGIFQVSGIALTLTTLICWIQL